MKVRIGLGLKYFLLHTSFYSILKKKIEWIKNALMVGVTTFSENDSLEMTFLST